jgi:hypothetical protein
MEYKRATIVFAALFLLFFVATSSGFANVSAIQEKLREVQLKLIGERIKQLQGQVSEVAREKPAEPQPEPQVSREELGARIETQIAGLEALIKQLKPRIIEEETERLEKEIARINKDIKTAEDGRLAQLQEELNQALLDYDSLNSQVQASLLESIRYQQALLLKEQLRVLKAKVGTIPTGTPRPVPAEEPVAQMTAAAIQEQIDKARLKLLLTQAKEIQENIAKLQAR